LGIRRNSSKNRLATKNPGRINWYAGLGGGMLDI